MAPLLPAPRIEAIHPVFLVLGGTAGLVYQALGHAGARGAEVARTAWLSTSAVAAALRVLAEHGLAEHSPGRIPDLSGPDRPVGDRRDGRADRGVRPSAPSPEDPARPPVRQMAFLARTADKNEA